MSEDINISNLSDDKSCPEYFIPEKDLVVARKFLLKGQTIGISISEGDNLSELGYSVAHLKDAMIEIARYILALGGKLAYGGDMRQGGFTELMFDLLAYYKADKELAPHRRFYSYLSWPLSLQLSPEKEGELILNVSFKKVDPPRNLGIADTNKFLKPDSPDNLYIWSRSLTAMRETMNSDCNARIFIGGKTKNFKGKCPGILEEFLIALNSNQPIYLVGAFGGITKDIIDAMNSQHPSSFTNEYYSDNIDYKGSRDLFNAKHPDNLIDYPQYLSVIQGFNFGKLSAINGLTESENQRLAITPHISEIVYWILKGLTRRFTV